MAVFKYRAVDAEGRAAEGTMEEASARRVVSLLESRGLTVNSVQKVVVLRGFLRKDRLSMEDLEQLNEQLVAVTRDGAPLAPALAALAQDVRKPRVKAVLDDIRRQVEAGQTLEEAFSRHPGSFPPVYVALIRAGERAGNLSAVFGNLSVYSKRMVELKYALQQALTYPTLLVAAVVCLVLGLLTRVVPVFADIFRDFGGRLPAPTRFLVGLSDLLRSQPMKVVAAVVVVAVVLLIVASVFRGRPGGRAIDGIKLMMPGFGRAYAAASMERFCRALGLLLQTGVPLTESLDLAGAAAGNGVLWRAAQDAARQVSGGARFSDALRHTGYFDNSFCWLLGNAEQRGEVDRALLLIADDNERAMTRMKARILTLGEVFVIMVCGFIVGFVVVSLYLPIFSLGDVISGH